MFAARSHSMAGKKARSDSGRHDLSTSRVSQQTATIGSNPLSRQRGTLTILLRIAPRKQPIRGRICARNRPERCMTRAIIFEHTDAVLESDSEETLRLAYWERHGRRIPSEHNCPKSAAPRARGTTCVKVANEPVPSNTAVATSGFESDRHTPPKTINAHAWSLEARFRRQLELIFRYQIYH